MYKVYTSNLSEQDSLLLVPEFHNVIERHLFQYWSGFGLDKLKNTIKEKKVNEQHAIQLYEAFYAEILRQLDKTPDNVSGHNVEYRFGDLDIEVMEKILGYILTLKNNPNASAEYRRQQWLEICEHIRKEYPLIGRLGLAPEILNMIEVAKLLSPEVIVAERDFFIKEWFTLRSWQQWFNCLYYTMTESVTNTLRLDELMSHLSAMVYGYKNINQSDASIEMRAVSSEPNSCSFFHTANTSTGQGTDLYKRTCSLIKEGFSNQENIEFKLLKHIQKILDPQSGIADYMKCELLNQSYTEARSAKVTVTATYLDRMRHYADDGEINDEAKTLIKDFLTYMEPLLESSSINRLS